MSSTVATPESAPSGALAGMIAGIMIAPLFVMVGLAVILNWGRS